MTVWDDGAICPASSNPIGKFDEGERERISLWARMSVRLGRLRGLHAEVIALTQRLPVLPSSRTNLRSPSRALPRRFRLGETDRNETRDDVVSHPFIERARIALPREGSEVRLRRPLGPLVRPRLTPVSATDAAVVHEELGQRRCKRPPLGGESGVITAHQERTKFPADPTVKCLVVHDRPNDLARERNRRRAHAAAEHPSAQCLPDAEGGDDRGADVRAQRARCDRQMQIGRDDRRRGPSRLEERSETQAQVGVTDLVADHPRECTGPIERGAEQMNLRRELGEERERVVLLTCALAPVGRRDPKDLRRVGASVERAPGDRPASRRGDGRVLLGELEVIVRAGEAEVERHFGDEEPGGRALRPGFFGLWAGAPPSGAESTPVIALSCAGLLKPAGAAEPAGAPSAEPAGGIALRPGFPTAVAEGFEVDAVVAAVPDAVAVLGAAGVTTTGVAGVAVVVAAGAPGAGAAAPVYGGEDTGVVPVPAVPLTTQAPTAATPRPTTAAPLVRAASLLNRFMFIRSDSRFVVSAARSPFYGPAGRCVSRALAERPAFSDERADSFVVTHIFRGGRCSRSRVRTVCSSCCQRYHASEMRDETADGSRLTADEERQAQPGVVVVFSGGKCVSVPLAVGESPLVLGRSPGNVGILLPDERLSRKHATIARIPGESAWVIRDCESRNGTFVDGEPLTGSITVTSPRVIRLGETLLLPVPDVRVAGAAGGPEGTVVGSRLRLALRAVEEAAASSTSLVIQGESGAGKELAARTFHAAGPHARGPFIAVNCAAVPAALAERLLFGTKRGAYSGAATDAIGYLQAADGGVLFLDEVGDLDLQVQAKLLRVLEAREVVPLGSSTGQRIDVRVCVAIQRDLRGAVAEGRFRADLYYRLAPPEVTLPPLRERLDEIPRHIQAEVTKASPELSAHVRLVEACMLRHWPGNVRELRKEVQYAASGALRDRSDRVRLEHLSPNAGCALGASAPPPPMPERQSSVPEPVLPSAGEGGGEAPKRKYVRWAASLTREQIQQALTDARGSVAGAARSLQMHRAQLYREMARWSVPIPAGDADAD